MQRKVCLLIIRMKCSSISKYKNKKNTVRWHLLVELYHIKDIR